MLDILSSVLAMFHHFNRSEELLREMVQIHENSIGFYDKIDKHLFNRSIEF